MNSMLSRSLPLFFSSLVGFTALGACNVDDAPGLTGGVDLGAPGGAGGTTAATRTIPSAGGTSAGGAPSVTACDRGIVVVESDYKSTNVALSAPDGTTLSGSFLSSGAKPPGLALVLSGDVELPAATPPSGRIVLLDRFGSNVITWADPKSARVLAQLPVGTGFESNPQDYLEVGDKERAYLTRYESNAAPGKEPFDAGGDILVLDTKTPAITKRIALPGASNLLPRPSEMLRLGQNVLVVLQRLSADFKRAGDGVLVGIDVASDAIVWEVSISGLWNCNRPTLSPDGATFALACSGLYNADTDRYDAAHSDIVVFDAKAVPPKEVRRYGVAQKASAAVQPSLAFASPQLLLTKTFGTLDGTLKDRVVTVDLQNGDVKTLIEASKGGLNYNGLWCRPGCGDVCLLADADKNVLQRWKVATPTTLTALTPVTVETTIGLPPRSLGGF